jgi:hypothetical protein
MSIRRLRVFDQHHPVCATKEREHLIDGAATPPRLRRGLTRMATDQLLFALAFRPEVTAVLISLRWRVITVSSFC